MFHGELQESSLGQEPIVRHLVRPSYMQRVRYTHLVEAGRKKWNRFTFLPKMLDTK